MDKAIKTLRQTIHLGIFWVAVCASLAGMLTYTKSGLEAVIAEQTGAPSATRAHRVTQSAPLPPVAEAQASTTPAPPKPPALAPAAAQAPFQPAPQAKAEPLLVAPPKRVQRSL